MLNTFRIYIYIYILCCLRLFYFKEDYFFTLKSRLFCKLSLLWITLYIKDIFVFEISKKKYSIGYLKKWNQNKKGKLK